MTHWLARMGAFALYILFSRFRCRFCVLVCVLFFVGNNRVVSISAAFAFWDLISNFPPAQRAQRVHHVCVVRPLFLLYLPLPSFCR